MRDVLLAVLFISLALVSFNVFKLRERVVELEKVLEVQDAVDMHMYINFRAVQQNQRAIINALQTELMPKEFGPLLEPLDDSGSTNEARSCE